MSTKIRNYTTTVPASKSIGEIQALLFEFGAEKVMVEAVRGTGIITGISFAIMVGDRLLPFRLPANIEAAQDYLWGEYRQGKTRARKTRADFRDEGYNVAWRIIKDWVHSQLSIIRLGQVKAEEVFLPYLYDGKSTLAHKILSGEVRNLLPEFRE